MIITNAKTGNAKKSLSQADLKTNEPGPQQILVEIRCLCYSGGNYEGGYYENYDGPTGGEDIFCFNLCKSRGHRTGEMEIN